MISLALAATLAASAPASAPPALLGGWVFGRDGEGAATCNVTLHPDRVIGGFRLEAPAACRRVLPRAGDLYAWHVATSGALVLSDPLRKPIVVLPRGSDGDLATAPGEPAYLFSRPSRTLTQAERMRGHWRLVALGGEPLCDFDIASNAAGTAGTLKPRGACKAPWTGRNFARWSLQGRRMTLADAAGKAIVVIADCGLGGCDGTLPNGDFVGFIPIFE